MYSQFMREKQVERVLTQLVDEKVVIEKHFKLKNVNMHLFMYNQELLQQPNQESVREIEMQISQKTEELKGL
jgi:hypothetical protein